MKFERHHEILKRLSRSGSVKVSDLSNNLNIVKETIRSDLDELARLDYLTRCRDGTFIVLDLLNIIAENEIAYAPENYDTAQGIRKSHSTMKSQVCVIGSSNADIISYLPRLSTIGESLLASNSIFSPGGKGCNQVLAANFTDTDVCFIAKVNTDHFSGYAVNFTNSSKVYKSVIYQTKETQTGTATTLVNEDTGDNVIAIYPGTNVTVSSDEITIQKETTISSDVIFLQLETNCTALQRAIILAQEDSIPVTINPASYNDIVNELIQDVDYVTPNETEAGLLSDINVYGLESARQAAEAIHSKGVENTVITLGSRSSLASNGKKFIHSLAFPVVVKNTAGTGGAFSGVLALGLVKGKSLESVLCYAGAFASLAVETSNTSNIPERESVIYRTWSIHYQ